MGQLQIQPRWTTAWDYISCLENGLPGNVKEVHSPKDSYRFVTLNKEFAFTNSVSQEVCFVCARQDLMLSEPLHCNTRPLLSSSETLGVKLSGLERLKSFQESTACFRFFQISDVGSLSKRSAHLNLLASRSDSSRVKMSPSLTGPWTTKSINHCITLIKECTLGLKMFERYGVVRQKVGQPTR